MKILRLLAWISCLFASAVSADMAGKPVVLVHGFDTEDLRNPASSEQVLLQRSIAYFGEFWSDKATKHFYWPSSERVAGEIKNQMRRHFEDINRSGICRDGCIFVTHSAGDLVLRDALSRLGQWGINSNNVKVLLVLDMAGAGGGTELADVATAAALGNANPILTIAATLFLGFVPTPASLGVINDLRPSDARSIAQQAQVVPRLRFVGTAPGGIANNFLAGFGDGVVPLHSACGSVQQEAIFSCSSFITNFGALVNTLGPSAYLPNHFPVIMGEFVNHSQVINDEIVGGIFVPVANNFTLSGINVGFTEGVQAFPWAPGIFVRFLFGSNQKSMSRQVYDTLNREN
jgi:hypothetical protein